MVQWYNGPMVQWSNGPMVQCDILLIWLPNVNLDGPLAQWSNGIMVQWSNGPMVNGPMAQWSNGPMVQWSNVIFCLFGCRMSIWMVRWPNGPKVQWSNGPMAQWSNGPMVNGPMAQWSNGPMVQYSNVIFCLFGCRMSIWMVQWPNGRAFIKCFGACCALIGRALGVH
jgi:hypothetical protein